VWKRRFPILSNGINLNLCKVQWIVAATAVLHNTATEQNERDPPALTEEEERNFNFVNNVSLELYNNRNNNNRIRQHLIMYFHNILNNN
jgi:hypothetical protein